MQTMLAPILLGGLSGLAHAGAGSSYFRYDPIELQDPEPLRVADGPSGFLNDLAVFVLGEEHEEWTLDLDAQAFATDELDIEDVERSQAGFRYRGGGEAAGLVVHLFVERVRFDGIFDDDLDLVGLELGVEGTPRFLRGRTVSPIMDYGLLLSGHGGEGDDVFDEVGFLEANGHLGLGVDVLGAQVAVGARASALAGRYDLRREVRMNTLTGDADGEAFAAANAGAYLASPTAPGTSRSSCTCAASPVTSGGCSPRWAFVSDALKDLPRLRRSGT